MQTARKVAIWTAVAGSAFAGFSSTPAHADTYVGTLSNKPAYEQPTFTIAVGPMIGVPIGDHAFENKSGAGLAISGTVRIIDKLSFAARFSNSAEPSGQAAGAAVDRRDTLINAGINYILPTPSPAHIIVNAMVGKHFSVPESGTLGTESGFGWHLDIGAGYVFHPNFALIGTVGYSYAWTQRKSDFAVVDFSFELLDFTLGAQARF